MDLKRIGVGKKETHAPTPSKVRHPKDSSPGISSPPPSVAAKDLPRRLKPIGTSEAEEFAFANPEETSARSSSCPHGRRIDEDQILWDPPERSHGPPHFADDLARPTLQFLDEPLDHDEEQSKRKTRERKTLSQPPTRLLEAGEAETVEKIFA